MSNVEATIVLIAIGVPFAVAHYVYRNFTAEFDRYMAECEAERQRNDQVMAGGAAAEVDQIGKE